MLYGQEFYDVEIEKSMFIQKYEDMLIMIIRKSSIYAHSLFCPQKNIFVKNFNNVFYDE